MDIIYNPELEGKEILQSTPSTGTIEANWTAIYSIFHGGIWKIGPKQDLATGKVAIAVKTREEVEQLAHVSGLKLTEPPRREGINTGVVWERYYKFQTEQ